MLERFGIIEGEDEARCEARCEASQGNGKQRGSRGANVVEKANMTGSNLRKGRGGVGVK